ncbi:hypothetical protein ACF0H5_001392 [Mactra antiquata]
MTNIYEFPLLAVAVNAGSSVGKLPDQRFKRHVGPQERSKAEPRITNGGATDPGQTPWMAAVYYDDTFICGGVIYSNRTILTAAQCVEHDRYQKKGKFTIKVDIVSDDFMQESDVDEIIVVCIYT